MLPVEDRRIEQGGEAGRGPAPNAGGKLATLLYLCSIAAIVVAGLMVDVALGLALGGVLLALFTTFFVLEV